MFYNSFITNYHYGGKWYLPFNTLDDKYFVIYFSPTSPPKQQAQAVAQEDEDDLAMLQERENAIKQLEVRRSCVVSLDCHSGVKTKVKVISYDFIEVLH